MEFTIDALVIIIAVITFYTIVTLSETQGR
jgi:hypothetical protein